VHEASGRVMGCAASVMVVADDADLAGRAFDRLGELERRWSRFLPDSEVSRVNDSHGAPCVVSGDTAMLAELLCRSWRETDGRFDPTQLDALVALGYAHSWGDDRNGPGAVAPARRAQGCDGIRVDRDRNLVWLPEGVRLDPGGLGKGLAADLVAGEVIDAGARGVLVDIGGDVRVMGEPPWGDAWCISVEHPRDPERVLAHVMLAEGGVATTSRAYRSWSLPDGEEVHHVLDPASGRPAAVDWLAATVVAPTAWQAEAGAKVAFVDGALTHAPQCAAGLLLFADGRVERLGADDGSIELVRAEAAG